jgi:hypothetical protein
MRSVSLRAILGAAAIVVSASSCASIWGFQEAVDLRDASTSDTSAEASDASFDATTGDTTDGAVAYDATIEATASDAPLIDEAEAEFDGQANDDAPDEAATSCPGACLPSPDGGWRGPFALAEVTDGGALDPCNPTWTEQMHLGAGAGAAPASCQCTCGAPENVVCPQPVATFWNSKYCTTECYGPGAPEPIGACTSLPAIASSCGPNVHFMLGPSMPEGGSCLSTTTMDAGPVAWAAEARLCAPPAGPGSPGCGSGTCFPPGDDAGAPPPVLCIAQPGTWSCPSPYDVELTAGDGGTPFAVGVTDSRACTCSCGAPSGVMCNSSVALYGAQGCTGMTVGPSVDAGSLGCNAVTGAVAAGSTWIADGGSCAPYGGPTGEVTPGPTYTICCTR